MTLCDVFVKEKVKRKSLTLCDVFVKEKVLDAL